MNLSQVTQWEKSNVKGRQSRATFSTCLQPNIHILATQLHHTDFIIAAHTMKLLQLIGLPEDVTMVILQAVSQSTVEFFFTAFHVTGEYRS